MAFSVASLRARFGAAMAEFFLPFPDGAALVQVPDEVLLGYTSNIDDHPDVGLADVILHNPRKLNDGSLRVHLCIPTVPAGQTYTGNKCVRGNFGAALSTLPPEFREHIQDDTFVAVMFPAHNGGACLGGMTILPPVENHAYGLIVPFQYLSEVIFSAGTLGFVNGWVHFGHPGFSVSRKFSPFVSSSFQLDVLRASRPVSGADRPLVHPAGVQVATLPVTERGMHSVISMHTNYLAIQNLVFAFPQPRSICFALIFSSKVAEVKAAAMDFSDAYVITVGKDRLMYHPIVGTGNSGSKL